ncbi:HlyD family efflux transporter periplasmic adaptor subunit [Zoogloea oleivorans]|uniref:HlyD family efflux transporter periplasmic adaptor subunit n=2 Tax=Zoogloea TaxID=349 RepID=A0A6C2D0U6_9RHOO|nr:HlyD family efflux transporter periplasmic adaptor subunit [Zoogloea oleivorans]TYC59591.1 HlyD family efflux transporter periplasmic adaptor subunit [Zoogloea oleivorans]
MLALQAAVVSHDRLGPSATAFASELATRLGCEQVAVGFVEDRFTRVVAISHGSIGEGRTEMLRAIGAAMDEAIEQAATVLAPVPPDQLPRIVLAHEALLRRDAGEVCSIPIVIMHELVGAVLLQFRQSSALSPERIVELEHAVALVGPVLHFMRHGERPWRKRLRDRLRRGWVHLREPGSGRLRAGIGIMLAAVMVLLAVPFEFRVGGNARVEGEIQRVLVAPADGFLKQALVRPGDLVKAGQLLAELAEQDLQLERSKWSSELAQHENAYSAAMARADRTQLVISQAKADEARAQLALVDGQIGRSHIVAPFDGVLIRGDLTQSLGAPVQRGDVLLTVAPRERFRVIVEVDERDIARIRVGQSGSLALSALPWDALSMTVTRITPMAMAVEGHNVFEVEAALTSIPDSLRPGLRGMARITVGREPLLWAWTHRLTDWIRLEWWGWWGR